MNASMILKGDVCFSAGPARLSTARDAHIVCVDGVSAGVFAEIPERFAALPLHDYSGRLILPGLIDLHTHAPQYSFRALGMDLELLEWLSTHTFPEESRYADTEYAAEAYARAVADLARGPNTRACLFATVHTSSTLRLMDQLESSGLITHVGKVNMDRNAPEELLERSAAHSLRDTREWLDLCDRRYTHTKPILTPRFIPSCTDELLRGLSELRAERNLPVQTHLSENPGEIEWVSALCQDSENYLDAYARRGLFAANAPAILAHCVWCTPEETELLGTLGAFVAHCPQSNTNLSSGIAPIRKYLTQGVRVGLGSDVAGGCHTSVFRAMADAIQVSKLRWRLVDDADAPLSLAEAFYLGTLGGGAYFGKVGSFAQGYEFDAIVLDDRPLGGAGVHTLEDRLARAVYLSDDRHIAHKFVAGTQLF